MIAAQAREELGAEWDGMTTEEQLAATRVHMLDCWNHLRNIFLKEQSSAMAKHVAEELKPQARTPGPSAPLREEQEAR